MNLGGTGMSYFGRKTEANLFNTVNLLPKKPIGVVVDCCFGSGNFSRLIGTQIGGERVIGYEKEKALYTLHMQIRDNVDDLVEALKRLPQTGEIYNRCQDIVNATNKGVNQYSDLAVAVAENFIIYNSHNNNRLGIRGNESFKKYQNYEERFHSKSEVDRIIRGFYTKNLVNLYGMSQVWQDIELINKDFRKDLACYLGKENCFLYIDPPYLWNKRGKGKCCAQKVEKNKSEYLEDWCDDDHQKLIDRLKHEKVTPIMICSNFELDENERVVGLQEDPYTELLRHGWSMYITETKHSSRILSEEGQIRKKKAEVVYVNYDPINDFWHTKYDVSDL